MEKTDFRSAVTEIFEYFRFKDPPNDSVISRWFDKVSYVPQAALPWIVDKIEENDSLPRNLPKLFQALWFEYRRQNPELTTIRRTECKDCDNMGFWFVEYKSELYYPPFPIQKIIICSNCYNAKAAFGKTLIDMADKMSKDEIVANEYRILPHDKTYAGRKLRENVVRLSGEDSDVLVDRVGFHVNPGERNVGTITTEDEIPF